MNSTVVTASADELLNLNALAKRWNCHPKTALRNARKLGLKTVRFTERNIKYRLSDIMKVEEAALA